MKKTILIQFLTVVISICSLISCNRKSEEEQLYIVDSIKLGSSMKEYETQVSKNKDIFSKKSGRIYKKLHFVTKMMLKQSEFYDYYIADDYTTTFNLNDNDIYTDYGLIVPIMSSTKDNLLGTTIYFGRTGVALDLDNSLSNFTHNRNLIPYFTQSNRALYISRVKDLLIKKYGQPTKITTDNNIPFYVFEGKEIQKYGTNKEHKGELLEWDNDIVKITFFTGIDNYNFTYDYEINEYFHSFVDKNKTKELGKSEEPTKAYTYLRYELKEDYIKRKKLDEPNL